MRQRVKQGAVALIVAVLVAACQNIPIAGMQSTQLLISIQDLVDHILNEQVDQSIAAIRQTPNSQDAYINFRDVLDLCGKLQLVIDRYIPLVEASPNDATLRVVLGILWEKNEQPDRAIEQYQKALSLQPDHAFAYNYWGVALSAKGDKDGAITKYQQAIQLKPDFAIAYFNWGTALFSKGDSDGAIFQYQQAIQLKPDLAWAYVGLGNVLYYKNDFDRAIFQYQQAIQLKPDFAWAYVSLGNALHRKGDFDQAIAQYQQAIQLQPDEATTYFNWGLSLSAKGDHDGAITKYQRTIQLQPDFATAYINWGNALSVKGDQDGAIAKYQKSLSLPDKQTPLGSIHALAQSGWGKALEDKGQLTEAIARYEMALRIDPKQTFAQNNLAAAKSKLAALENIDDSQQLPQDEPRLPLLRSTVLIIAQFSNSEDTEHGAAWVVKRQGSTLWLVTCAHLFRNERNEQSQAIQVQFYNPNLPAEKRASRAATMVQLAPSGGLDLAVLKVENAPADIRPLAMGLGSAPVLTLVYTIGHPDILAQAGPWQALSGEVTGRFGDRIGLNMTISQGNSGGPLLHKDTNQVIGIVFQRQGDRVGYAYDIQTVQTQLRQWGIL